jgi:putative methyltransferase (TIGR04325 family)
MSAVAKNGAIAMSVNEVVIDALATKPCRWLLTSLEGNSIGTMALNKVSYPRCVFGSFEEGWRAARRVSYAGHDHPDLLQYHAGLAGKMRPSDYAVLYWLLRTGADPLRVLDYSGSVGNIYYSYAEHLRKFAGNLEWIVFDLPKSVEEGKRIALQRGERGLQFTSSLAGLEGEFIVLVSSAFHYWEKSVAEFIAQLPFTPEHIIVNRVPVVDKEGTFVTVQHKKRYAVPCMVRNSAEFISDFARAGYRLVDSWTAPEFRIRMPLFPEHDVPAYSGFYFSKESAKANVEFYGAHQAA